MRGTIQVGAQVNYNLLSLFKNSSAQSSKINFLNITVMAFVGADVEIMSSDNLGFRCSQVYSNIWSYLYIKIMLDASHQLSICLHDQKKIWSAATNSNISEFSPCY